MSSFLSILASSNLIFVDKLRCTADDRPFEVHMPRDTQCAAAPSYPGHKSITSTLRNAKFVLQAAKTVAGASPIPQLQTLFAIAGFILKTVEVRTVFLVTGE